MLREIPNNRKYDANINALLDYLHTELEVLPGILLYVPAAQGLPEECHMGKRMKKVSKE